MCSARVQHITVEQNITCWYCKLRQFLFWCCNLFLSGRNLFVFLCIVFNTVLLIIIIIIIIIIKHIYRAHFRRMPQMRCAIRSYDRKFQLNTYLITYLLSQIWRIFIKKKALSHCWVAFSSNQWRVGLFFLLLYRNFSSVPQPLLVVVYLLP